MASMVNTSISKVNLIVIDDDPIVQNTFKTLTRVLPDKLYLFENEIEFLKSLIHDKSLLDKNNLIFIDDDLPGISAVRLGQMIKEKTNDLSLVMLCDGFNANNRGVSKQVGFVAWLEKPLDRKTILQLIGYKKRGLLSNQNKDKVQFKVKTGRLGLSLVDKKIALEGAVNDNSCFERIAILTPPEQEIIEVNWKKVNFINVEGIKAWSRFNEVFGKTKFFLFSNCPPELIEFFNMMPHLFGENIQIASFSVPVFNRETNEFSSLFFADETTTVQSVLHFLNKKTVNPDKKLELACNLETWLNFAVPRLPMSLEQLSTLYFEFFETVNKNAYIEMYMTRETVLDQCSQMMARIDNFDKAIKEIIPDYPFVPIDREDIVPHIIQSYDGVLQFFKDIHDIISLISLKKLRLERGETNIQRDDFAEYVKTKTATTTGVVRILQSYKIIEKEAEFLATDMNDTNVQEFILFCFGVIKKIFYLEHKEIEEKGQYWINILSQTFDVQERLKFVKNHPIIKDILDRKTKLSKEQYKNLQLDCLLTWDKKGYGPHLIKQAIKMLEDVENDQSRAIVALMSHDLVNQLMDHRINEIQLWEDKIPHEEMIPLIRQKLVTVIEQSAYSFQLAMEEQEPEEQMDLDEITFF